MRGVYLSTFLIWTLDGGEWSASRPGRFTPRERASGARWIGLLKHKPFERQAATA